ncbi:MAG: pyrroline-5-carboxylate reductase [Burkholderiaceae bacterium]|nr:pyrroline-5-carboxylate reductase [Burkholderiaceae bacterium]
MNIAFIGGGNMAHAMLSGLRDSGFGAEALQVLEPDAGKGAELARQFGIIAHTAPGEWLRAAGLVVLAVKPQQMREAVDAVGGWLSEPLVLSIAAGVRGRTLARWLGHERIVRAMPNTPALIRAGITGAAALAGVSGAQREAADRVLRSIGTVLWLDDEAMLDAVTAVSGSGPAYVFTFIEALQEAAQSLGFSRDEARQLALHTFVGAARLASESNEPVATLRERVTSKGGTTAAALARMEASGVRQQIVEAVRAARDRAMELGDALDDAGAAAPPSP